MTADPPPSTPVPVSGNWTFGVPVTGSTTTLAALPPFLAGSLMVSGTQISADFLAVSLVAANTSNCTLPITPDVILTGAVADGKISLTSVSWGGSVLTVTGTVSSDGRSISGSWSAKGGCIDGQSGTFLLNYVPPITGTWTGTASNLPAGLTGTATNSPLAGAIVTLQLQQSSTPVQFYFPLSGSVTFSGTNCGFTQGSLVQPGPGVEPLPSFVAGDTWTMETPMDDGQSKVAITGAQLPTSPAQWLAVITVVGGKCDLASAQVTLAKQ